MKILVVHNHYLNPGGEDQVFRAEAEVLGAHGEEVRLYTRDNRAVASMHRLTLAASTLWNREVFRELTALLRNELPDVVHCHNTFPLISPAAYAAARRLRIPVVQTLHNFRLLCVNGLFLRQGRTCEDCLGRSVPWPGVVHACYRNSRSASVVAAGMLAFHRWRGTWATAIDTYVVMSEFARAKFVAGGLPPGRIVVKPNFLSEDPGIGGHSGGHALYVGRLSPEKGIEPLVRLWGRLQLGIPLRVIGSGPLERLESERLPNIEWLGWQTRDRVLAAMKEAAFLIFPTECYEGFPMVLVEAMATGLPVVATNHGSLPEIVQDGATGVLVRHGDHSHWNEVLKWAVTHPGVLVEMGRRARQEFERNYTAERGYRRLIDLYQRTLERAGEDRLRAVGR